MKKILCFLFFLFGLAVCYGTDKPIAIQVPEIDLPLSNTAAECTVTFPAVPARKGLVPILKGRFFYAFRHPAGWNNATQIFLNGKEIKNVLPSGARRLLYRGKFFVTAKGKRPWYAYGGWLFYFCNGKKIDRRILEPKDEACWYCFDVSDLIHTDKENTLKIRTKCRRSNFKIPVSFTVRDSEVIYFPEYVVKRAVK